MALARQSSAKTFAKHEGWLIADKLTERDCDPASSYPDIPSLVALCVGDISVSSCSCLSRYDIEPVVGQ